MANVENINSQVETRNDDTPRPPGSTSTAIIPAVCNDEFEPDTDCDIQYLTDYNNCQRAARAALISDWNTSGCDVWTDPSDIPNPAATFLWSIDGTKVIVPGDPITDYYIYYNETICEFIDNRFFEDYSAACDECLRNYENSCE